jgi:hypothetical protein
LSRGYTQVADFRDPPGEVLKLRFWLNPVGLPHGFFGWLLKTWQLTRAVET